MRFLQTPAGWLTLSFISGILLAIAWPASGFAPLLLIAFVPLLFVEDVALRLRDKHSPWLLFGISYFGFLTFNILTTWWVKEASLFGGLAAMILNALFMAMVFQLFHITRTRIRGATGYAALPVYWIAFEFLHMDWDLSWPWLTLGNGFAGFIRLIQWYEFTGVLGGSLWIFLVNILLYNVIKHRFFFNMLIDFRRLMISLLLLLLIPIGYSYFRYFTYKEKHDPVNITVIQPNVDPYNEKFSSMGSEEQLQRIMDLARSSGDSATDYFVAPETAIPDGLWEEGLKDHPHTYRLRAMLDTFPKARWVIGLVSHRFYPDSNQRSATARRFTSQDGYYDSYNTAMQLERNGSIQLHHKSKLVPGVEKMPFPTVFKHLDRFAIDLGGISGSLGVQDTPSVFTNDENHWVSSPVICYESIYGNYVSKYIRRGANLIFIITNDGWWGDSPGYRQHVRYASMRAIEARRSIARSANTGISCFVNQRGEIIQATNWWEQAVIKSTINANSQMTFYSRYGDYIGRFAGILSMLLIVMTIKPFLLKRKS